MFSSVRSTRAVNILIILITFVSQYKVTEQVSKLIKTERDSEENHIQWAERPLSILMIANFFPSHLYPILSLGEELVRRGHNVTLCTTIMEGSRVIPSLPEKLGINILSAGADDLTQKDYDDAMLLLENSG